LTNEFNNLPIKQSSFSVQNSLDFINRIKDIKLIDSEILVSFDVSSLFPSVPIPQTLEYFKELLLENHLDDKIVKEYIQLTEICMKQNIFQINDKFYQQNEGTAMGNFLSPFIADLFMSRFEKDLEKELEYFSSVWLRYVDDIFAIFDTNKGDIDNFIGKLNKRFESIKFTWEREDNNCLPFLDTLVHILEFDVYRKDTNTLRYIPNDSNHSPQQKMPSLNFLVHRLLTFPLSKERYRKELSVLRDAAKCNGFDVRLVDKIIDRFKFKQMVKETSTFRKETFGKTTFVTLPYIPALTKALERIFRSLDLNVAYTAGPSLQSLLGNPKDSQQE
jgi:hypothetical protein